MAITWASSVPGHNLPVGKKGEKDSGGNLESIGTYRGFFEVSVRYVLQRARAFPEGIFSARIPHCDNLQTGTEDS